MAKNEEYLRQLELFESKSIHSNTINNTRVSLSWIIGLILSSFEHTNEEVFMEKRYWIFTK